MKRFGMILAVCLAAALAGCGTPKKPAVDTQPKITLDKREVGDGTIMVQFRFTEMERLNWRNKVLRAQLVKWGEKPVPGGAQFKEPSPEFVIMLNVGKPLGGNSVLFVPAWGVATDGNMGAPESPDFCAPGGKPNTLVISGQSDRQITQIFNTCVGPGHSIPFDPEKGIDLLTVGFLPDAWNLHVWVEKAQKD